MSLPSDSKSSDSWTSFKGSSQRTGTSSSAFLRKPTFKTMIELGPILSSPVSDNASVYVCTITGRIYRIEISGALTKWHINTSSPIVSTPSIYKGLLIVGTFSNWVGDAAVDISIVTSVHLMFKTHPRYGSSSCKREYFRQSVLSMIFMFLGV